MSEELPADTLKQACHSVKVEDSYRLTKDVKKNLHQQESVIDRAAIKIGRHLMNQGFVQMKSEDGGLNGKRDMTFTFDFMDFHKLKQIANNEN